MYFAAETDQIALKQTSMQRLGKVLQVIETALSPGPWFLGEDLSVIDFCFGMQAVWPEIYPNSVHEYPNIERMVQRLSTRPSVQKVLASHKR